MTRADTRWLFPVPEGPCRKSGFTLQRARRWQTPSATRWTAADASWFSGKETQFWKLSIAVLPIIRRCGVGLKQACFDPLGTLVAGQLSTPIILARMTDFLKHIR